MLESLVRLIQSSAVDSQSRRAQESLSEVLVLILLAARAVPRESCLLSVLPSLCSTIYGHCIDAVGRLRLLAELALLLLSESGEGGHVAHPECLESLLFDPWFITVSRDRTGLHVHASFAFALLQSAARLLPVAVTRSGEGEREGSGLRSRAGATSLSSWEPLPLCGSLADAMKPPQQASIIDLDFGSDDKGRDGGAGLQLEYLLSSAILLLRTFSRYVSDRIYFSFSVLFQWQHTVLFNPLH